MAIVAKFLGVRLCEISGSLQTIRTCFFKSILISEQFSRLRLYANLKNRFKNFLFVTKTVCMAIINSCRIGVTGRKNYQKFEISDNNSLTINNILYRWQININIRININISINIKTTISLR